MCLIKLRPGIDKLTNCRTCQCCLYLSPLPLSREGTASLYIPNKKGLIYIVSVRLKNSDIAELTEIRQRTSSVGGLIRVDDR